MEGAGAPKIPGADKRQEHSVSFKTIVITVYPEVFWRADAFQLIGFGSFATFCTFDRGLTSYQLPALSLCLLSIGWDVFTSNRQQQWKQRQPSQ